MHMHVRKTVSCIGDALVSLHIFDPTHRSNNAAAFTFTLRAIAKLSSETYVAKWVHEGWLLFEGHVCCPHSSATFEKIASLILHDMYASRNLVPCKTDSFIVQVLKSWVPLAHNLLDGSLFRFRVNVGFIL